MTSRRWIRGCALVIALGMTSTALFASNIIHVGLGAQYTYNTIQGGIDAAAPGDTVLVHPGTYTGMGNRDIVFGKAITVQSVSGAAATIVDCQGSEGDEHRGFLFCSGVGRDAVLDGFTVTNGYLSSPADTQGGGIYCDETSPTIRNNIIIQNHAPQGGGIFVLWGSPRIESNVISGNDGVFTGGGIHSEGGDASIVGNLIQGNTAYHGGGIFGGTWEIRRNTITGNTALDEGGGFSGGSSGFTENIVSGNQAGKTGGGMWAQGNVVNNVVTNNSAGESGGGILLWGGGVRNTTIANNSADEYGGGVACTRGFGMFNSIVWGNEALKGGQQIAGVVFSQEISISYTDVQGGMNGVLPASGGTLDWGDGNIDLDPLFTGPDDYHLSSGSPCIDAGVDKISVEIMNETFYLYAPLVDLDGNTRPFDFPGVDNNGALPDFDMGAYEVPEPTTIILLGAGIVFVLRRRSRSKPRRPSSN